MNRPNSARFWSAAVLCGCGTTETGLNRELRRDEHVHHLDGNRVNNLPSNLLLMSAGAHGAHTHRRHALVHYCQYCGEPFMVMRGPRQRYCSLACSGWHRYEHRRQQPERPAPEHPWRP